MTPTTHRRPARSPHLINSDMPRPEGRPAARVAAGILLTRILGLVRERSFAQYFGDSMAADAYRAALRIPNVIRNLLGEGTLSASFIPVYAAMIERGEVDGARRLSGAIASLLVLVTAAAALLGLALAPAITDFAAPGFSGATRDLTVTLLKIMFPMSGIMIMSAWCLGVLNTHRRFFLSYAAPTLWNIAQITTLLVLGGVFLQINLVVALAWGALIGSLLQIGVQLPSTLRATGGVRWILDLNTPGVRKVIGAWIPVVFGAGVMQISSIIDTQLGSLLGPGAVATLGYAQLVAVLPISLFGISIAASALPELSREAARTADVAVRDRLANSTNRVAFFILPSAFALVAFGPRIIAALFQTGAFGTTQTAIVSGVLAAYGIGLPAQAMVKLLASGHYALGDTRTPVKIAALSVVISATLAALLMQVYGVAGIAFGASLAAYVNVSLNYTTLRRRTGGIAGSGELRGMAIATLSAILSVGVASLVDRLLPPEQIWLGAIVILGLFGTVYLVIAAMLGHPDARRLMDQLRRRARA